MAQEQDWCLSCGTAAPGRLGERPGWRAALTVLGATLALVAVYCSQEALEGALARGHPAGAGALLGDGGWAALPLAVALGLLLALVVRGAERAIDLAAEPPVRVARPLPAVSVGVAARGVRLRGRHLARHLGGRSPPCNRGPGHLLHPLA
jgi:hypothetical protein